MSSMDRRSATLSILGQEADVRFYLRRAEASEGPILVLGCADGRIALELASAGYEVTGVDPSVRMIAAAEERRARDAGGAGARLRLLQVDLRVLRLSQRFPLVLAPQNALGLVANLEDLEAVLVTAQRHLEPSGEVALDLANPPLPLMPPAKDEGPERPSALEPQRDPFTPHLRERRRDSGDRRPGGIHRLRLRPFQPRELEQALEAAGLTATERYGSFAGKPFDPGDPLQIVVAVPGALGGPLTP